MTTLLNNTAKGKPCVRRLVLYLSRAAAYLDASEDADTPEPERAMAAFFGLGSLCIAQDEAADMGARSPVPAGALIAARAALERGQAAAALEAARKILRLLSHPSIEEHTP